MAAPAFDGPHERSFFAADKRTGTDAQLDIEVEAFFKEVLAEQAVLVRLVNGDLEALDGQRIFGADINESAIGAGRVRADDHAFEHAVRVAFDDRAVHERAGITFVGVADDVLRLGRDFRHEFPLEAGR